MANDICGLVRKQEQNYTTGTVKSSKYVSRNMYQVTQTVDAYLNSVHTAGLRDSLGREKPFFNIVTAASNVWYRATDLDRKDLVMIHSSLSQTALTLAANIILQEWMNETRFGHFLNDWGRTLARYGSAVCKFVQQDGGLKPSIIPWMRLIVDPIDFTASPVIER